MARTLPLRAAPEWDPLFTRMTGVSAIAHVLVIFLILVVAPLVKPGPLPIVAYTVELTDPSALGGHSPRGRTDLPPGPRPGAADVPDAPAPVGEAAKPEPPPEPPAKPVAQAPGPAKPIEPPPPQEPVVKLPSLEKPPAPKPEAKKPEPAPKPEAKPAPKKPEAEVKQPELVRPALAKSEPAKAEAPAKPAAAQPAAPKPAGKPAGKPEGAPGDGGEARDDYAAAAQKWRAKGASGGGGGLGGTDAGGGPIGSAGYGAGGGQVVGIEFIAYQQRVISTVKAAWVNAMTRAGIVAKVRFRIAPTGEVSAIRLEQASGDAAYDATVLRAVQRANPLPPPPARYVDEFREFLIEFRSEEGGQGAG